MRLKASGIDLNVVVGRVQADPALKNMSEALSDHLVLED
jgi:hypothetical protein